MAGGQPFSYSVPHVQVKTTVGLFFLISFFGLRKQISEMEEKPFTSSLHICPEAYRKGRGKAE